MGIEEIKKAKEEAKRTFTRPSQKVAALLIALGPTTASEILKNIKHIRRLFMRREQRKNRKNGKGR